ncbi:MAG: hypothetical protein GTO63_15845 [Anaerolineae bacterium]|nr:hypothetical protein [Anaerolineae bacterium]NIN96299.1 hypothetical protein [Anaerolineae bacterium]NIQ79319.1 hypothetical protein [Anaerolineae bacterium]
MFNLLQPSRCEAPSQYEHGELCLKLAKSYIIRGTYVRPLCRYHGTRYKRKQRRLARIAERANYPSVADAL